MFFRSLLLAALAALPLFLTGCQSPLTGTAPAISAPAERMQAELGRIVRLESSGRIGSIAGENRQSLGFSYRFDGAEEKLELISPIGSSVANIRISAGKVVIRQNDKVHVAADLRSALSDLYGLNLPVSSLRELMTGRAIGDSEYDGSGLLQTTRAGDYEASFAGYRVYNGIPLPTAIEVRSGEVLVRIRQSEIRDLGVTP